MLNATLHDKAGDLLYNETDVGGVDYATGILTFAPDLQIVIPRATYSRQLVGTETDKLEDGETRVTESYRTVLTGTEKLPALCSYPDAGSTVTVKYRTAADVGQSASETVTLDSLSIDLTPGYAERVVPGSLRMGLGGKVYVDKGGFVYTDPDAATGAGIMSGTLDPTSGRLTINAWVGGGANAVTLESLSTEVGGQAIDAASWRTPISPLKPGTVQVRFQDVLGTVYSKSIDSTGRLEDDHCTIRVDYDRGIIHAKFGRWRPVSALSDAEKAQPWYSTGSTVDRGGALSIWQSKMVLGETIIYNAVAQTFLPPYSELLGLDAARLPPDGKSLIFRTGQLVVTHHTASLAVATLSPTQEIDCERTRLYRVVIEDSEGARLGADQYTIDRVLGTVTMSASLDTTGFVPPWSVKHTVADLARTVSTDINGTLTFMSALSHEYPKDESYCSGVLFFGTLQARVSNLFAQSTWTSVWSDTLIGAEPLAQYNDTLYPITVLNDGAYPDRYLVKFTSGTAFQVIGENTGLIATGDVNTDCEPINSLTTKAYFKIDHRGWGAGWATGYCLRFNVHGACYPMDMIRAVQPSQRTEQLDSVELLLVGNVDATGE